MPLLIAVILGLVLFFIKKDDSARKAENKKETDKEWNLRQDFRDEYTNRQFENQVLAFVENPEHREQVNQEIAEALSEMRYQSEGINIFPFKISWIFCLRIVERLAAEEQSLVIGLDTEATGKERAKDTFEI